MIALPGVPGEMSYLLEAAVLPYLRRRLGLSAVICSRVLKTAGAGKSWLDEKIADLERTTNPTVGLSAHPGQVDVRITAKAGSSAEAERMLDQVDATLRERLGYAVFGVDSDTLEAVDARRLADRGWRLALVEHGTGGAVAGQMAEQGEVLRRGPRRLRTRRCGRVGEAWSNMRVREFNAEVGLGVVVWREPDRQAMLFHLATPDHNQDAERSYGGPPENASSWAVNMALDFLRRRLA